MSVFTKMLSAYLVIALMIAVSGYSIFSYVGGIMEETLYKNLYDTSSRMSQQLDSLIRPMEYTSLHLLSNHRFLAAAEDLAGIDRTNPNNLYLINYAENEINSVMMSYSFYKYFYRVSVFNRKKDFFSSNYNTPVPSAGYWSIIDQLPWLELLRRNNGKIVVLPPYDDPWNTRNPEKVFAVSRSIRGNPDVGYIEVQQPYSSLSEIFRLGDSITGAHVCAVTKEGGVLYGDGISGELLQYYRSQLDSPPHEKHIPLENPVTGKKEVFAETKSDYTGIAILLVQDHTLLIEPLNRLGTHIFTLYFAAVATSLVFFILQSRNLVLPLRQLKREMEATRLENLPGNTVITTSNDEIRSLNNAYVDLKDRLGELIERELSLRSLHMQASFDALQAQVNPHFLYNVLGLISNRAVMQGDDVTACICGSIATMLRYSVDTKERLVTLADELDHLENYVCLMKERYEHRLIFTESIDDSIRAVQIPKMVLQPLVENTINHGFANMEGTMRIAIAGWREGGEWRIRIDDNGQGFSQESLATIRESLGRIDRDPYSLHQGAGLGGLGIVNIYARLRLFFPEKGYFDFGNNPECGAWIMLGGLMHPPASGNSSTGGGR